MEPLAPLFLPAALVLIPIVFQLTLLAIGVSLQEAADTGACQARFIFLLMHTWGGKAVHSFECCCTSRPSCWECQLCFK